MSISLSKRIAAKLVAQRKEPPLDPPDYHIPYCPECGSELNETDSRKQKRKLECPKCNFKYDEEKEFDPGDHGYM